MSSATRSTGDSSQKKLTTGLCVCMGEGGWRRSLWEFFWQYSFTTPAVQGILGIIRAPWGPLGVWRSFWRPSGFEENIFCWSLVNGLLLFLWVVIVPMLLESDKLAKYNLEP